MDLVVGLLLVDPVALVAAVDVDLAVGGHVVLEGKEGDRVLGGQNRENTKLGSFKGREAASERF